MTTISDLNNSNTQERRIFFAYKLPATKEGHMKQIVPIFSYRNLETHFYYENQLLFFFSIAILASCKENPKQRWNTMILNTVVLRYRWITQNKSLPQHGICWGVIHYGLDKMF